MEKLELKHIVGYLPYGVTVSVNIGLISPHVKIRAIYKDKILCDLGTGIFYFDKIKPILRPLSDLTKEIEVNSEKFVPIEYFEEWNTQIDFVQQVKALQNDIRWLSTTSYVIVEKLYEWHFDIHGLIGKGLAFDINTVYNGIQ